MGLLCSVIWGHLHSLSCHRWVCYIASYGATFTHHPATDVNSIAVCIIIVYYSIHVVSFHICSTMIGIPARSLHFYKFQLCPWLWPLSWPQCLTHITLTPLVFNLWPVGGITVLWHFCKYDLMPVIGYLISLTFYVFVFLLYHYNFCFNGSSYYAFICYNFNFVWPYYIVIHMSIFKTRAYLMTDKECHRMLLDILNISVFKRTSFRPSHASKSSFTIKMHGSLVKMHSTTIKIHYSNIKTNGLLSKAMANSQNPWPTIKCQGSIIKIHGTTFKMHCMVFLKL